MLSGHRSASFCIFLTHSPSSTILIVTTLLDVVSSPTKIRRGAEGAEEDFTSFVESALSPLASGNYTQSAENSRDAFSISNSQSRQYHFQPNQQYHQQQQHEQHQQHVPLPLPLNVPSSNEWSPNISQSSFGGSNNEFKLCFNEAPSPGGGFPSETNTGSHLRHQKTEGSEGDASLLQQPLLSLGARVQQGSNKLRYSIDEGALNGQNSNGAVAMSVMEAEVVAAGRQQAGGAEPFQVVIPGYAKSSLDLDDEGLGRVGAGQSPQRDGSDRGEMQLSPRMSNAATSRSNPLSPMRGPDIDVLTGSEGGTSRLPVTAYKYGIGPGGATRARRKTPKASEAKLTKGKQQVGMNAMGFGSLLKAPLSEQRVTCNCKKSKCLKLYCECFHALKYCSGCNCYDCENRVGNDEIREAVIATIKERNPDAFDSKMKSDASGVKQHNNGCHCKRSACLKKYCECFSLAIPCGVKCRCLKCQNTPSLYQLKEGSASFTAAMFVSAAAASLEDTGEEYLNVSGSEGASGAMPPINARSFTELGNGMVLAEEVVISATTGSNSGYISPGGSNGASRTRPAGSAAPASPGMSLLELAGACTEQQKTEDTAQGLLALSPARVKPTPSSQDSQESQAALF